MGRADRDEPVAQPASITLPSTVPARIALSAECDKL
jgi:hypothetical protein